MKLKLPSLGFGSRGFTIMEILVSGALGSTILGVMLTSALSHQRMFQTDVIRTRLNQDLRGAIDTLGTHIRQAGENVTSDFPVIEIINGTAGASDQLIIRRSQIYERLTLCTAIANASTTGTVVVGLSSSGISTCNPTTELSKYDAWNAYRTADGGSTDAFLYHPTSKLGQFFNFSGYATTSTQRRLTTSGVTWARAYPTGSRLYLLEELQFRITNGYLEMIRNRDTAAIEKIAYNIDTMAIQANMQDGSILTDFTIADSWRLVASIQLTLSGSETFRGQTIDRQVSDKYLPRNVFSSD